MDQTNRGESSDRKVVVRIRIRRPHLSDISRRLFSAVKNFFHDIRQSRLRWHMLVATAVIVLSNIYSVLDVFYQANAYAMDGKIDTLLPESSPEMASKISYDSGKGLYSFKPASTVANSNMLGQPTYSSATLGKSASQGVTVSDPVNNIDFKMTPQFKLQDGKQTDNRIVYPLKDGNGWAIYTLQGDGVKEDIVLNYAHGDTASYSYKLQLGSSLSAKIESDGSLGVYGNTLLSGNVTTGSDKDAALLQKARENAKKDTLLFRIPAPVVMDEDGIAKGISAKYTLSGDTLTIAATGMKKGKYPLTIDPSIYVVTAQQFMQGNNESNINFDVNNKLIKKGRTTGARFNSWNSTTAIPTGTWGAQTVPAGGYVYQVGGTTSSGNSSAVNWAQFNTNTGTIDSANPGNGACSGWCTNSAYNLPDGRSNFSLVAYNGFLYAIGGTSANCTAGNGTGTSGYCKTVYVAKLSSIGEPRLWHPTDTNQANWVYWYRDSDLSTERAYTGAAVYNNSLYLLGGRSSSGAVTSASIAPIMPSGKLGTWSDSSNSIPSANAYNPSVQSYNGRLYVIGGASSPTTTPTNTTWYSNINSDGSISSWMQTTSFATGRRPGGGTITTVWNGYVYISGGCSAVNASGYCTTIQSDTQVASINADGSLDNWYALPSVTDSRTGQNLLAWRDTVYEIGGCSAVNSGTGNCDTLLNTSNYGTLNQDGDASIVSISSPSGTAPCSGTPYNCNMPSSIGNTLNATAVVNGYLYIMGGCTNNACSTSSTGVTYQAIGSDGTLQKPATCTGSFTDSYCVSSTSLPNATAAAGTAVFNDRIYLVGGFTNGSNIYYTTVNADGSIGSWTTTSLSTASSSAVTTLSYAYAYARANPASANTSPGNLYIIGGCTNAAVSCTGYSQAVLKCNIATSGAVSSCSTSGQQQIGAIPNSCGTGIGGMAGTVYANYIYLIGGFTTNCSNLKTVRYAKFDNSNNIVAVSGSAWIEGSNQMNTGRQRNAGFGYNGYLYAVGGYDSNSGSVLSDIEFAKINVGDGSWGTWTKSSISIGQRWGISVPVSNSYAYIVGGCTTGTAPSSCSTRNSQIQIFQVYNNNSGAPAAYSASANTFSTDPNRVGMSAIVLNGYLYVAGGCTSTTAYCTTTTGDVSYAALDVNGSVGSWSSTNKVLPASRSWGKLRAAGGTLYYIGGQDSSSVDQTTVYYATPLSTGDITTTWATASNGLPNARSDFGATVWNDQLYVVGGSGSDASCSSGVCSSVYVSPALHSGGNITTSWSTASTSFNVARRGATAIAYANNLYVLGGYDGTNYLSDTQFSQINTSTGNAGNWTYSESMPQALSQGDGFAANGYIYMVGGKSADNTCSPITLVAPVSANTTIASGNNPTGIGTWFETNQRYTGARYGNAAFYNNGKAYVLGGMNCSATNSTSYSTGGSNSYVVPAGTTTITVKMWGAGGGSGGSGSGGALGGAGGGSGAVTGTLAVTPGSTLTAVVGKAGGGGNNASNAGNGGGGGGYSSLYNGSTALLIAAGGGGGGGAQNGDTAAGGPGGCTSSGTTCKGADSTLSNTFGGGGGSTTAGGAGGSGTNCTGGSGSSLQGGSGSGWGGTSCVLGINGGGAGGGGAPGGAPGGSNQNSCLFGCAYYTGGGGGGGGYFGGGGGGSGTNGGYASGGGGGGSNYLIGTATSTTSYIGSGATAGNSSDSVRGTAGNGASTPNASGNTGLIVIYATTAITPVIQQTGLLSQPQIAQYSIMMDTDTDVYPLKWLLNGVDNNIGARWQMIYRSMTDPGKSGPNGAGMNCSSAQMTNWGKTTAAGDVTLGLPTLYTALDSNGINTNCARYYFMNVSISAQNTFGYPDDVTRGPTITDLTLNFTADPSKRLMHGRTFIGGQQMPNDTPN